MEYERVFKRIIIELQRCQDNYEEMLVLLLRHLLITFHRELTREHILKNEYLDQEMNTAVTYFSENYNQDINIEDYAASRGMSVGWFYPEFRKIRRFHTNAIHRRNPDQQAQMLRKQQPIPSMKSLKSSDMITSCISVGFFHKLKGYSPREYRKLRNKF